MTAVEGRRDTVSRKDPVVRPRDAAGLVLLRGKGKDREILLGRRRRSASFLPGVYVFPGGGLEPEDRLPSGFREELPPLPAGLDRATQRKSAALLRAAIRETLEETGVMVGRRAPEPLPAPPAQDVWRAYHAAGVAPAFEQARLLTRAITPAASPIRFHTRFFLMDATEVHHGEPRDDELEDVAWVPLREVKGLPMIDVTLFVLEQALLGAGPKAELFNYRNDEVRADLRRRFAISSQEPAVGKPGSPQVAAD